jgi:hypothetical protein
MPREIYDQDGPERDGISVRCSFCRYRASSRYRGIGRRQAREMVKGDSAYICDACVAAAEELLRDSQPAAIGYGTTSLIRAQARNRRCDFCDMPVSNAVALASADDKTLICSSCLEVCREALDAEWRALPGGGMVK